MAIDSLVRDAVKMGDKSSLHSYLTTTIMMDPLFQSGDFTEMINFIKSSDLDIFEMRKDLRGELTLPEDKWDDQYFYRHVQYLNNNFSKERLEYVKRIGKKVFSASKQQNFSKVPAGAAGQRRAQPSPQNRAKKKNPGLLLLAGAAIVAAVLIYLLVKSGKSV